MTKNITKFGLLFFLLFQISCANEKNQYNNNLPCLPNAIKERFNLNVCFGNTEKELKNKIPEFRYEKSTNEYIYLIFLLMIFFMDFFINLSKKSL